MSKPSSAAISTSLSFALGLTVGIGVCAALSSLALRVRQKRKAPRRYGGAIRLNSQQYDRYTQLHDAVWPGVLERMSKSNIRNFTIYYHAETGTMFSHFEWIGHWKVSRTLTKQEEQALFDEDMAAIANDPLTKIWWKECEPCQQPFSQWDPTTTPPPSQGGEGDWWAPLVCLNHCGHFATDYAMELCDPDFEPRNPSKQTTIQPRIM